MNFTLSQCQVEGRGHRNEGEGEDQETEVGLKPITMHTWVGGDGKFGMLKSRNIPKAEDDTQYVRGMRDPYKAAQSNPNLMSLGIRIRAAWETFVKQFPGAIKVAETYGTPHCEFSEKYVNEWKRKPWGPMHHRPSLSWGGWSTRAPSTRRSLKPGQNGEMTKRRRCRSGYETVPPLASRNPSARVVSSHHQCQKILML